MAKSIQESPLSTQSASKAYFAEQYQRVRRFTEHLCEPLVTEDYVIQSMPDVSPTKWHLAHVSWSFQPFLITSRFTRSMRTSSTRTTTRLDNGTADPSEG